MRPRRLTLQSRSSHWMKCVFSIWAKKGELTVQLQSLGKLPPEERRTAGQEINVAKEAVQKSAG